MKKTAIVMLIISGLLVSVGMLGSIKTANAMMDTNYFENREKNFQGYSNSMMPGWRNYQDDNRFYGRHRGMMGWQYDQEELDFDDNYQGMMRQRNWQKPLSEGEKLDKEAAKIRAQEFIDVHGFELVVGDITEYEEKYFEIELNNPETEEIELKLIAEKDTGFVYPEYCHGNMGRFNGRRNWQ